MADVDVTLDLDASAALKSVETFSKKSVEHLEGVNASLEFMKHALEALAVAEVLKKIGEYLKEVVEESAEADRGLTRLANAMRATGDFSQRNLETFEGLAKQLAQTTRFTEEQAISSYALAKNFNATNEEAGRLVQAAAKLAIATGKDLPTATELLSRSLDGTVGRLGRVVPGIQALTKEQLVAGGAIDFVLNKFNYAKDDVLPTYGQALNEIEKKSAEYRRELGNLFVQNQVVIQAIKGVADIYFELKEQISANKDALREWISDGVIFAVQSLGVLVESLRLVDNFITRVKAGVLTMRFGRDTAELNALLEDITAAEDKRAKVYDGLSQSLANLKLHLDSVKESQSALKKENEEVGEGFDELAPRVTRFAADVAEKYKALVDKIKTLSADPVEQIQKQYAAEVQIVANAMAAQIITVANGQEKIAELWAIYGEKIRLERKRQNDEELQATEQYIAKREQLLKDLQTNPFQGAIEGQNRLGLTEDTQNTLSRGIGGIGQILQGRAGAQNLINGVAEGLGKAFLGIPGIGQIVGLLSQGPEQVRAMIDQFADAVPDIVTAIAKSIPVVIEELGNKLPDIIENLAHHAPEIAEATARAMAISVPIALANSLKKLFGDAGQKLIDGAGQFISKIIEGAGRFIDALAEGIGKILDKANPVGGNFLGSGGGGSPLLGGAAGSLIGGAVTGPIGAIGGALFGGGGFHFKAGDTSEPVAQAADSGGSTVPIVLKVGERELARVLYDLNRRGFQTA